MGELVNSKNGINKDYAKINAPINKSEPHQVTTNSAAKENLDEIDFIECALTNKTAQNKAPGCYFQKSVLTHFRFFLIFNTPSVTAEDFLETGLSKLHSAHGLLYKNMFTNGQKTFKCIKIRPDPKIRNDFTMRIKKCFKESNRIVAEVNVDAADNTSIVIKKDNQNRDQKVVDKILKRKRQTCRKQFRHKDITLYKLGSGNNNESVYKKEVMQKAFQRQVSNPMLPQKQHLENCNECHTSKMSIEEKNLNESFSTDDALENNCNSTLSKLDFKPKFPLRLTEKSDQLHMQRNVSTENSEVSFIQITKHGPSDHSIESLTSQPLGKHNLPIRIPERRSSIAEPLHTSPISAKLQNGQNASAFNFLTTNAVQNLYSKEETSTIHTVGNNDIRSNEIYPTKKSNEIGGNKEPSVEEIHVEGIKKIVLEDQNVFFKCRSNHHASISESSDVQSKVYVSKATTSHNLLVNTTTCSRSLLHSPSESKSMNTNKHYATKKLKRKKIYSLNEKDKQHNTNSYLTTPAQNFFSPIPLDVYNYSQNNLYLQSLLSYNQTKHINTPVHPQATIPTYIPYEHPSNLLSPIAFNYSNHSINSNSNKEVANVENQTLNTNHVPVLKTLGNTQHNSKFESFRFSATSKTDSSQKFNILSNSVHNKNPEYDQSKANTLSGKNENELVKVNLNKPESINVEHDIKKHSSRVSCSSPVIISDSDADVDKPEEAASNLEQNKLLDSKTNLSASTRKSNINSTQTRVLETLSTLTYVVNEIIDKAGDNMRKQDKELLHKLLEGVCQNSSMSNPKKPEYIVKQENYIELISSDSELSNEGVTDSIGSLDLSTKKFADSVKSPNPPVLANSSLVNAVNETTIDSVQKNLIKECNPNNDDDSVINLSVRDERNQLNSYLSKDRQKSHESLSNSAKSTSCNNAVGEPSAFTLKLGEMPSDITDRNNQQRILSANIEVAQNNKFDQVRPYSYTSSNNDNNKSSFLVSNLVPRRTASCNLTTNPADFIHRQQPFNDASFYQTYGNNSFQNLPSTERNVVNNVEQSKLQERVNRQYERNQFDVQNKNSQKDYSTVEIRGNKYCEKPSISPTKKSAHVNHPKFTDLHCNNFDFSTFKTNKSILDHSLLKVHRVWQQCKTSDSNRKKIHKNIKELLKNKKKQKCAKTTSVFYDATAYVNHNDPNVTTQAETSEVSRGYKDQSNSYYNNQSNFLYFKQPVDTLSKKPFPIHQKAGINLLDNEKRGVADMAHPVTDLSFVNKKRFESDVHTFHSNLSPDYGYFSPLSKFTVTENTQHTDVTKAHSVFSKDSDSVSSSVLDFSTEPANTKNPIPTCQKNHSLSPLLHPEENEKLLKILPKLHAVNTLTPEQYVLEVHTLEKDGCPRPILDFYSYITKKQIASNQKPVCFRIFLEFHNAGKLRDFEKAFKIYSEKHENEKHALKVN
ncbi:hypothetical protein RN001_014099 [Aquatica leii]|uniref:Uncharacterized protein n=1 Tax=Aquatica leii TaxID=1421715 RepID=A0AAN7SEC2_9COLE|nr:hypothetical protein RN001_014099 [Aquatica leii]